MTKHRVSMMTAGVLLLSAICAGILIASWQGNTAQNPRIEKAAQGSIVIDEMSGETFTPEGNEPSQPGLLSSDAAFQKWGLAGEKPPPAATVQRGYLTFPTGSGEFTANHQLVYAYSWPQCMPSIGAPGSKPTDVTSPSFCTQWVFLDAATADLVDMTWSN